MALEKPLVPTFSLSERDRRWSALRVVMKQANFDALIALPHEGHWDQFGCDTRYITQIGGTQTEVGCVLPLEGDVTAVVRGANEIEWWGLAQDWVKDIRPSRRSYGEPVIERLKELRSTRVGVIALSGMVRAPEGVVPWGTFEKIRQALPAVKFDNATPVMQEVRAVKSAEEIAFIEKAAGIIGKAIDVLIAQAKVGVGENELIGEMLRGADGAAVSTVTVSEVEAALMLPAASEAVAARIWLPSVNVPVVKVHAPPASAVTVPI